MRKRRNLVSNLLRISSTPPKSQRGRKLGKAPGTVTYLGSREGVVTKVTSLVYDQDDLVKSTVDAMASLSNPPAQGKTQWINVTGLSDEPRMVEIGNASGMSSLVVEDIVNTEGRPKVDEYEDYIFIVLKMLNPNGEGKILKEHIAIVLRPGQVFLYQEVEADVFDGIRNRIEQHSGRIRTRGADYLFFALIDAIVDHYFLVLDALSAQLDSLEIEVYRDPHPDTLYRIQQLRKDVVKIRGWMAPVRELVTRLIETESPLISKDTRIFLRDIHDHTIEINETLHIQREMAFGLMEIYMSNVSNKMNEVMKVLTIMASIFIPLTFLAGIYGMNFRHMPELEWEYGYYGVLGLMLLIFIVMIIYFKKKGWL
ncbi:MAG: magnesium/cobalt transporter CorA [Bacteroidetes bacterium]|jgi:magnesium transporter|nr:MAG: magnesium/cobalt transporter CorA [Bacteroidota bacterium]UCE69418.1 MAG: magnesium/cobalt transporter CorA [Flavobacteriaceae bacterium]